MDTFKLIASKKVIELFGESWVRNNADKMSSNICDMGENIEITFIQNDYLPSEECAVSEKGFNRKGLISFMINKKSKHCEIISNTFVI